MNIFEFERKYEKELTDVKEWSYLRIVVANILKNSKNDEVTNKINQSKFKQIINNLKKIKNIFYGFRNWFKTYDYFVFSDTLERRFIEYKYMDKISDDIINNFEDKKILLIELPNPNHYSISEVYTKNIVSRSFIDFIGKILNMIYPQNIKNIDILDTILNKHNISISYKNIIKSFNINKKIYYFILKIYKPKAIFINCAYCNFPLIKAANELNIKIIELQHGIVNNEHYGYNSSIKLNKIFYPQILFTFGNNINTNLINKQYSIGSFYLDYLNKNFKKNNDLLKITSKFDCIIGISMQDQDWEQKAIFDFIIPLSKLNNNILYILIPRKRKDFPKDLPTNIIVYDKIDCYNVIMHCDIHCTLYSSCALEAPTLGLPNLLINENNIAINYYKDMLLNFHTKYISKDDDIISVIKELKKLKKDDIKYKNSNIFIQNYKINIIKAIKQLGLI